MSNSRRVNMNQLQIQSSVGQFVVKWNELGRLTRIDWGHDFEISAQTNLKSEIPSHLELFADRLYHYLERGEPLDLESSIGSWDSIEASQWTEFQKQVYKAICQIPHGETRTYAWVAKKIGKPLAVRAVGQALRRNPIPLLIPCHRVVSADDLGGFMGSRDPLLPEIQLKKKLINIERDYVSPIFPFLIEAAV